MPVEVAEAMRAVVMKAMALDREGRYGSVGELALDVDAYVGGFATSAERAGRMRRVRLWVGRNRVVAGAVAVLMVFGVKVVADGQKASRAMRRLSTSAPVFASRAEELLRGGDFQGALEAAENAVDLDASVAGHHVAWGNALQVLMKLEEAKRAFGRAVELGGGQRAEAGLKLTEEVIACALKYGEAKARVAMYEGLNREGRQMEALAFGKAIGDFWKDRSMDRSVIPELLKRLEAKMLPVPGASILLSKTELTVGEWKLYLKAEGLPAWEQPAPNEFAQSDDHPVVKVSWYGAVKFCEWLSQVSGRTWRLPNNSEWEAAVGKTKFPWGDYFPPKQEDGNYRIREDGGDDRSGAGIDGVRGTASVGSFKANPLGFLDLGGNVSEWVGDGFDASDKKARRIYRGGCWYDGRSRVEVSEISSYAPADWSLLIGFRLALEPTRRGSR
jgi:tetratricopeptide (TPR) repeat protein